MKNPTSGGLMAMFVAAAVLVAGCGDDRPSSTVTDTKAAAQEPAVIAFVSYAYTDFTQAEEKGLKTAVEPGGGSVKVFDANFDPQKQSQQCTDAIASKRYNVIVLAASDAPLGVPCVTAAKAANIPVVALELPVGKDRNKIEPQLDGVVGSAVLSANAGASLQAKQIEMACEGVDPCKVIIEIAAPGDPTTGKYVEEAKKIPNVDVVQTIAGNYDPGTIAKLVPDVLTAHPDIDVYMAAADSQALAAFPAFKQAGLLGKVKIIGAGGSIAGKKAIEDGTQFSTSANYPQTFSRLAGEMAIKAVNGQTIDPAGVDVFKVKDPVIITKENVGQFEPEWGASATG